MKKVMSYLFVLLALTSCDSNDKTGELPGADVPDISKPVDRSLYAILKDAHGNDLLNPAVEGYVDLDESRLYSLVNGSEIMFCNKDYDAVYGFLPRKNERYEGSNYAIVHLVWFPKNGYSTEIIKWNELLTDTVKCELDYLNNIQKVYVNGELVHDNVVNKDGRYITFYH